MAIKPKAEGLTKAIKPTGTQVITTATDDLAQDLRLLRAILNISTDSNTISSQPRRPKTPLAVVHPQHAKSARNCRPTGKEGKQNGTESKQQPPPKPPSTTTEQRKFAMNCFNQSLKVLSTVVRKRQANRSRKLGGSAAKKDKSTRNESQESANALEEDQSNILHNAECACEALAVLRKDGQEDTSSEEASYKREQGAVLLLDRMITLDLRDMAHIEASRILEQYWKRRKVGPSARIPKRSSNKISLSILLSEHDEVEDKQQFDMLTSCQSQVLRLAILLGPEVVSEDFVHSVRIETETSPASIVTKGQKNGFVTAKTAGENLRTISQALSKISLAAMKPTQAVNAGKDFHALDLLVEAHLTNITSWQLSGHMPDLGHEYWMPIEKGLKTLWRKQPQENPRQYERIKASVKRLQAGLQTFELLSALPASLELLLSQLAELHHDDLFAMESLKRLNEVAAGCEKLSYACRMASIVLQARPTREGAAERIDQAATLLTDATRHREDLSAEDLIFVVRLRKACFEELTSSTLVEPENAEQAIKAACLRTLPIVVHFCHHFWKQEELSEKLRRSLHLASLKGIENILDAENCATTAALPTFLEYLKSLEACVEIVSAKPAPSDEMSKDEFEPSVLHSLKTRISNVFWRSHLHPSVIGTANITAMKLAQISIACLDGLPTAELSISALGPRLEKLCAMCARDGDLAAARSHIERAIKHYILTGALSDAVEASLSKRSGEVWMDTASLASQLGRALHTRNSMSVTVDGEDIAEDCIYSDESLPPIHQAVLLEHQISYLLRKHANLATLRSLGELVSKVVELTSEPQYNVWVVRFVSLILFRASRTPLSSTTDTAALLDIASRVLCAKNEDASTFLGPYSVVLKVQLKIQCILLAEVGRESKLREDLEDLLKTLESCSESRGFDAVVDDCDRLQSVLQAYTDQVFALYNYDSAILCLKIRILLNECQTSAGQTTLSRCYTQLTLAQVRLDDVISARLSLDRVEKMLKTGDYDPDRALRFNLASAEYYLATSDFTKCASNLSEAGSSFTKLWPQDVSLSNKEQIERDSVVSKCALLASALAQRQGDSHLANQYARQAAKISVSIWAALERHLKSEPVTNGDSTGISLTEDMSKLHIKSDKMLNTFRTAGPRYWPYLDMHVRNMKHLASILTHSGLCADALHYLRQLENVAFAIPCAGLFISPAPASSLLFAKSGRNEEASQMIDNSTASLNGKDNQFGLADAMLYCCEASVAQGNFDRARTLLLKVPVAPLAETNGVIEPGLEIAQIKPRSKARRGVAKSAAIRAPPRRQNGQVKVMSKRAPSARTLPYKALHLSYDHIVNESRRKAIALACQESSETVPTEDVQGSKSLLPSVSSQPTAQELYEEVKHMLSNAWKNLRKDAFTAVLTESATALPSRMQNTHRRARVSVVQSTENDIDTNLSWDASPSHVSETARMLQSALYMCNSLLEERRYSCPTDLMHSLLKMEARISLLLTSMSLPFITSSTDLVLKASQPKDCALERERIVSLAEEATQDRTALSAWPSKLSGRAVPAKHVTAKQLNDLPAAWSVLTLALAEGNDELLLSRTVAGSDPFLVRIPLRRSTDDDGTEDFLFEDAEDEMKEIIEAANSSSHDIRGTADKATRARWHTDREKLDRRLASLLENLENIWLGGFHGVLSPYVFEAKHIKQFGQCLAQSLNRNLPSRQKGSVAQGRVEIHDHILEVFLGLGNPAENDLDDSIMDLLYFVVDILQFNGERNAYDEIDWDVILVDVLDALKSHYNTVTAQQPRHTILILDKELELFPWEALPCLINHPVSRMPSLGSIFDRLTQIRAQSSSKNSSAYRIDKSSAHCAYILNPSDDLTSTQESLEPILHDNLSSSNYKSVIGTPPTEPQFSSLLRDSDILLYIGHGSGAQYIRPRTIRALPSCAVSFLFGCSSAKMTTHGAFESTGMPRAYMLGHAPAVVGCLWDVTDREIDRVAVQTMVSWGLIDGGEGKVQDVLRRSGRKGTDKGKKKEVSGRDLSRGEAGGKKTLIEAVKGGREACVLRYLCGAAVVVYGVPVVLE